MVLTLMRSAGHGLLRHSDQPHGQHKPDQDADSAQRGFDGGFLECDRGLMSEHVGKEPGCFG